jgi:hypothetical protein
MQVGFIDPLTPFGSFHENELATKVVAMCYYSDNFYFASDSQTGVN